MALLPHTKLTNTQCNDANKVNANFGALAAKNSESWYFVSNYDTLGDAINDIGSSSGTIVIDEDTTITANTTIPATLKVFWISGAEISGAYTLTINGKFVNDPLWQIFDSTITTVTLYSNATAFVRPEWWGGGGSASAATNSTAIQAAIDSGVTGTFITNGATVLFDSVVYSYDTTLQMRTGVVLRAVVPRKAHLQYTGTGHGIIEYNDGGSRINHWAINGLRLSCSNASSAGDAIHFERYSSYGKIHELYIDQWGSGGIHLGGGLNIHIYKTRIIGRDVADGGTDFGIKVIQATDTYATPTTIVVDQCYITNIVNSGADAIGMWWAEHPNVAGYANYKCCEFNNIIESSDIGRSVEKGTVDISIINPYNEANTTDLVWTDATGYVVGGGNPNDVATFTSYTNASKRVVPYKQWASWTGYQSYDEITTTKLTGALGVNATPDPNETTRMRVFQGVNKFAASFGADLNTAEWLGIKIGLDDGDTTQQHKAGIFFRRTGTNGRGELIVALDTADDTGTVELTNSQLMIDGAGKLGLRTLTPESRVDMSNNSETASLTNRVYSTTTTHRGELVLRRSHTGTKGTEVETEDGDWLGAISFKGVNSGTPNTVALGGLITAVQDGNAGTYVPTKLTLYTFGASAANDAQLVLNPDGSVDFNAPVTASGRIVTDDTTEAATTTDGSLQTDGGLSVAKGIVFGGAMSGHITTVADATYNLTATDLILHVTRTASGTCTITLPTAQLRNGRMFYVKDAGGNASVYNITINTQGAETIDGEASVHIDGDYEAHVFYSDGSNWFIL